MPLAYRVTRRVIADDYTGVNREFQEGEILYPYEGHTSEVFLNSEIPCVTGTSKNHIFILPQDAIKRIDTGILGRLRETISNLFSN